MIFSSVRSGIFRRREDERPRNTRTGFFRVVHVVRGWKWSATEDAAPDEAWIFVNGKLLSWILHRNDWFCFDNLHSFEIALYEFVNLFYLCVQLRNGLINLFIQQIGD
jgi:hypothetical protein